MSTESNISVKDSDILSEKVKQSIRMSIYESALSTILMTLVGGAFLTGFALSLGASNFQIGIIAALPTFANLTQILGSYLITKTGKKKYICLNAAVFYRIVWLIIVLMPFFIFRNSLTDLRVWLFVVAIALASVFASLAGVAWLSWITELIPESIRGRFLSNRNAVGLSAAMFFALLGGQFIDRWKSIRKDIEWQSYGFSILFAAGLLCGFIALLFLLRMPDSKQTRPEDNKPFFSALALPLADTNFRKFIFFSAYWGFAVSLVSPFFNVYLIQYLGIAFSVIATLDLVNGIFNILSVRIWGKLTDKFGNKPLLFICTVGASFFPFFWLFANKQNYYAIWFAYIIAGLSWSGIGVNSAGLMMRLSPLENNSVYFAVFAAITGLFSAIAPIVGGSLGKILENISLNLSFKIQGLQILFGISFILRLSSVLLLKGVESPKEATVADVIINLKKMAQPALIVRAHRAARYGMYPIENMNLALSRGTSIIEGNVERVMDFSTEGVKRGWHMVVKVNQKFALVLLYLESVLNSFADWLMNKLYKITDKF